MAFEDGFIEDSDIEIPLIPIPRRPVHTDDAQNIGEPPPMAILPPSSPVSVPEIENSSGNLPPPISDLDEEQDQLGALPEPFSPRRRLRPREAKQLRPYSYDRVMYGDIFKRNARESTDSDDKDFVQTQMSMEDIMPSPRSDDSDPLASSPSKADRSSSLHVVPSQPYPEHISRKRIIDSSDSEAFSGSESDSDSESEAEVVQVRKVSKPLQFFKEKFTGVLPASVEMNPSPAASQQEPKISSSLRDSLDDDSLGFDLLSQGDDIPETSIIDYMPSRGTRSGALGTRGPRKSTKVSLDSLVKKMGDKAAPYMHLAARTARKHGRNVDTPDKKFVVHSDGTRDVSQRTLARWKKGFRGTPKLQPPRKSRETKRVSTTVRRKPTQQTTISALPVSSSSSKQARQHLPMNDAQPSSKRPHSSASSVRQPSHAPFLTHGQAPEQPSDHSDIDEEHIDKPKRRRRRRDDANKEYHTTIVEVTTGRYAMRPSHNHHYQEENFQNESEISIPSSFPMPLGRVVLKSSGSSFNLSPIPRTSFSASTFLGSNTLDLMSDIGIWNGIITTRSSETFAAPLQHTTPQQLKAATDKLISIALGEIGEIDRLLFVKIYDYLLQASSDMFRQDSILDETIRKTAVSEAARLVKEISQHEALQYNHVSRVRILIALFGAFVLHYAATIDPLNYDALCQMTERCAVNVVLYHLDFLVDEMRHAHSLQLTGSYNQTSVAIEAAVLFSKFGQFSRFFDTEIADLDHSLEESMWALIFVQAASHQYLTGSPWDLGWSYVLKFLRQQNLKRASRKLLLERCLKLITTWKWPVNPEIVFIFFDFFAKEQNYADPNGEAVDLPDFYFYGKFDGTSSHEVEHHTFLELLGLTLQRYRALGELTMSRRIVGRVTPLSTLVFPETKPVSAADLSRVSQQYGILLVCIRFCDPKVRPLVRQVIDLVDLHHAHIALRVKALSAWQVLVRILSKEHSSLKECHEWITELCSQSLTQYRTFKLEQNQPSAVQRLDEFFLELYRRVRGVGAEHFINIDMLQPLLHDPTQIVKQQILELLLDLSRTNKQALLRELSPAVIEYLSSAEIESPEEIRRWASILASFGNLPSLFDRFAGSKSEPIFIAQVVQHQNYQLSAELQGLTADRFAAYIVRPVWNLEGELFKSLKRVHSWITSLDDHATLTERIPLVGKFVHWLQELNEPQAADKLLHYAHTEYRKDMDTFSRRHYDSFVSQVRRLVFEAFPPLTSKHNWFNDAQEFLSLEISQRNLLQSLRLNDFQQMEFFFAYKLRASLDKDQGSSFTKDVLSAVQLQDESLSIKGFDFVLNKLFAFYGRLALHKPLLERLLPLFISISEQLVDRDDCLKYAPTMFLKTLINYIQHRGLASVTPDDCVWGIAAQLYQFATGVLRQAYLATIEDPAFDKAPWLDIFNVLDRDGARLIQKSERRHLTWTDFTETGNDVQGDEAAILQALDNLNYTATAEHEDFKKAIQRFQSLYKNFNVT